jgi:lysophospholipase L1-like esterase
MGSSTAAGFGASSYQLSWAGRLEGRFNKDASDGVDTIFYNIAIGGYNIYQELPSSFLPPTGRPAPDPLHNVTQALSFNPDVVIINLPSNDIGAGFSITETMDNFRWMYNNITASGAKCYITTTQPRNDYSVAQRQALFDTKDSINHQFGLFAINFWDDLVTADGLNMLRDDRRDPTSAIHPNDIGHDALFRRLSDKNIFGLIVLPITISSVIAVIKNNVANINWHAEQVQPNTLFETERSTNGKDFASIFSLKVTQAVQSADYAAADQKVLPGNNYYRIKVTDPTTQFYSDTISVFNPSGSLNILKLYRSNSSNGLIADISTEKNENIWITIYNITGSVVLQKKQYISMPSERVILPVANLAAGEYFFKICTDNYNYVIRAFIK